MQKKILEIREMIVKAIKSDMAELFYFHSRGAKFCIIGDMVFEFFELSDGSFEFFYLGARFLWMRETDGWDYIRDTFSKVSAGSKYDSDELYHAYKIKIINLLHGKLLALQ